MTTAAPSQRPARGMRWRAAFRRVLPYLLVAGTGFVAAYLVVLFFVFPTRLIPNDTPVPNVVGLTVDEASRALNRAGFSAQVGETRADPTMPPLIVLGQRPAASAMQPKGSTILIDVSAGPRP
jgi:beta-lactam-binding protein with PASTA domain